MRFYGFQPFTSPSKNLLLQEPFISGIHVEQCSMFVQELFENKNRVTSDVICQFYGWSFLAYTSISVWCKTFRHNGHFKMQINDTTMNPLSPLPHPPFNTPFYAVSSAGGWIKNNMLNFLPSVYVIWMEAWRYVYLQIENVILLNRSQRPICTPSVRHCQSVFTFHLRKEMMELI